MAFITASAFIATAQSSKDTKFAKCAAHASEYAWGINGIASSAYTLSNSGQTNEVIATNYSTTAGNASYVTTDV